MIISEVAARAGVNIQTLRYYERRGLLAEPERTGSGYRIYPEEAVARVVFVKRAQALGFSLEDIEALLALAAGGSGSCAIVKKLAREKADDLDRRIEALSRMRSSLQRLLQTCDRGRKDRECPLLASLQDRS